MASMKKQFLKSKPVCKVTFELPRDAAGSAQSVSVVGEFNGWKTEATPMRRQRGGSFKVTLDLDTGREYQFRYLIDGKRWENDRSADRYVPSPFADAENGVVAC